MRNCGLERVAAHTLRRVQRGIYTAELDGDVGDVVRRHWRIIAGRQSLNADFTDLVIDLAEAARDLDIGVAVFIDEMQHLAEPELAAICQACHAANQQNLSFWSSAPAHQTCPES